nr:MAG TPA: Plastocyanin [Caudoviricetes sp.]
MISSHRSMTAVLNRAVVSTVRVHKGDVISWKN